MDPRQQQYPDPSTDGQQPPVISPAAEREALDLINEFFYGVRVFPGQDPNLVYVGWVTTQYHIHSRDFSQDIVRTVTIQSLDSYGRVQQR